VTDGGYLLNGTEYVLIAEVPRAGARWHQVHFNAEVVEPFFRIAEESPSGAVLEGIDATGTIYSRDPRPLVFPESNRNRRIEFDFGSVTDYPEEGRPILLVLELEVRRFRYLLLLPGSVGHREMESLNQQLPRFGQGLKRSRTNLDTVENHWPGCPLRRAHAPRR
jgi:hypothetical protein